MITLDQCEVTEITEGNVNFEIKVKNSVINQLSSKPGCHKVVKYGHKIRIVKDLRSSVKFILLIQIVRCTTVLEDHTEIHHYHELLPNILLPFLQYTVASFAILKYSSDKSAGISAQDKPEWCTVITYEQWSFYMDKFEECSPARISYFACEASEQRLANRSGMAAGLYLLTMNEADRGDDDSIESINGQFLRWIQEWKEDEAIQKRLSLTALCKQNSDINKVFSDMVGISSASKSKQTVPAMLRVILSKTFDSSLLCSLTIETGTKGRIFNPIFYVKLPNSLGFTTYPFGSSDRLFKPPGAVNR